MNTSTDTLETNTPKTAGGYSLGQSATDLVGFFGADPIVRPSHANQGAITDGSGGTANLSTGVAALTGSYNSTIIANALATVIAVVNRHRTDLVALGLIKGGA